MFRFQFFRRFATIGSETIKKDFFKEEVPPREVVKVPFSKYGGKTTVTMLTGSEVGVQGSEYIKTIFEHAQVPVILENLTTSDGEVIPNEFLLSVMRNGTAFHIDTIHEAGTKQKSLLMNTQLDLYACVVNCFAIPGYGSKFSTPNIAVVMQNNGGDFSKLEYEPVKNVVETIKICERKSLERYIDFAFKFAVKNCRKKITFGHKNDELPLSDGLHLEVAKRLHQDKYPEIQIEEMFINKITKSLILDPSRFDVICLNDKYGTFVTAVLSGICGGASLFSAVEIGDSYAIFKPLQTKLSITDSASLCPYGTISTAASLLKHIGYNECADLLYRSLFEVMVKYQIRTYEFGGSYSEDDVITKLLEVIKDSACLHIHN